MLYVYVVMYYVGGDGLGEVLSVHTTPIGADSAIRAHRAKTGSSVHCYEVKHVSLEE